MLNQISNTYLCWVRFAIHELPFSPGICSDNLTQPTLYCYSHPTFIYTANLNHPRNVLPDVVRGLGNPFQNKTSAVPPSPVS